MSAEPLGGVGHEREPLACCHRKCRTLSVLPHGRLPKALVGAEASEDTVRVAASGHGLILVDALATRWGSTVNDLITKTVWAEL